MVKTLMNNVKRTGERNATEEPGGPRRPMMVGHEEIELMVLEKQLLLMLERQPEQPCELPILVPVVKLLQMPLLAY